MNQITRIISLFKYISLVFIYYPKTLKAEIKKNKSQEGTGVFFFLHHIDLGPVKPTVLGHHLPYIKSGRFLHITQLRFVS